MFEINGLNIYHPRSKYIVSDRGVITFQLYIATLPLEKKEIQYRKIKNMIYLDAVICKILYFSKMKDINK